MEASISAIKKLFFVGVIQYVYCYLHHTHIARWRLRIYLAMGGSDFVYLAKQRSDTELIDVNVLIFLFGFYR